MTSLTLTAWGRTREQVAARAPRTDSTSPARRKAQQNLLDVVVGKALLLGQFAGRDGTLSRALS